MGELQVGKPLFYRSTGGHSREVSLITDMHNRTPVFRCRFWDDVLCKRTLVLWFIYFLDYVLYKRIMFYANEQLFFANEHMIFRSSSMQNEHIMFLANEHLHRQFHNMEWNAGLSEIAKHWRSSSSGTHYTGHKHIWSSHSKIIQLFHPVRKSQLEIQWHCQRIWPGRDQFLFPQQTTQLSFYQAQTHDRMPVICFHSPLTGDGFCPDFYPLNLNP